MYRFTWVSVFITALGSGGFFLFQALAGSPAFAAVVVLGILSIGPALELICWRDHGVQFIPMLYGLLAAFIGCLAIWSPAFSSVLLTGLILSGLFPAVRVSRRMSRMVIAFVLLWFESLFIALPMIHALVPKGP